MKSLLVLVPLLVGSGVAQVTEEMKEALLKAHNTLRCMHGAPPLVWDDCVAANAQEWANTGTWGHAPSSSITGCAGPSYENMARAFTDQKEAVTAWYGTASTAHFKAIVWKGATKLGCGFNKSAASILVCRYKGGDTPSCNTPNTPGCEQGNVLPHNGKDKAQCEAESSGGSSDLPAWKDQWAPLWANVPTGSPPASVPPESVQWLVETIKSITWGGWEEYIDQNGPSALTAQGPLAAKAQSVFQTYTGDGPGSSSNGLIAGALAARAQWVYAESSALSPEGERALNLLKILGGPLAESENFPMFLSNLTAFSAYWTDLGLDSLSPSSPLYVGSYVDSSLDAAGGPQLLSNSFWEDFKGVLYAFLEGTFKSLLAYLQTLITPENSQYAAKGANDIFASLLSHTLGRDVEALIELESRAKSKRKSAVSNQVHPSPSPSPAVLEFDKRAEREAGAKVVDAWAPLSAKSAASFAQTETVHSHTHSSKSLPELYGPWYLPPVPSSASSEGVASDESMKVESQMASVAKGSMAAASFFGGFGDGLLQGLFSLLAGCFDPSGFGGLFQNLIGGLLNQFAGGILAQNSFFDLFQNFLGGNFLSIIQRLFQTFLPFSLIQLEDPRLSGIVKEARKELGLTALKEERHASHGSLVALFVESFMSSVGPGLKDHHDFGDFCDRVARMAITGARGALSAGLPYVTPTNLAFSINQVAMPHAESVTMGIFAGRGMGGSSYSFAQTAAASRKHATALAEKATRSQGKGERLEHPDHSSIM
uniref:SCP domain-containing protein n=1 Tax=Chromera velia CCMP2878 TaxID=1169474 RepID=A0A0G4FSS9_9ALVE|eukprot:Cvel_3711.t1-p1 / transcript=Cvel_3711.t1 / gene=Cvel_3711 / organism=Chromera_velia_CCMP2878 / gene_product=Golgi-associated plant pathogenesis-related protein, putative / transcript_product=Golgi-associated plant pathogenesis-related protein, putative / location=Cvel_scaffold154:75027-78412(+) / protein_length=766 / sequence_SO=supercontig / SO=protein_coding / is_pseudo=false